MAELYEQLSLPDAGTHFRLLRFLANDQNESLLQCQLEVWPISEAPSYAAISYVWGSPEPHHTIHLNGRPFTVGPNCDYTLRQAAAQADIVWVDCICINQGDPDEKAVQVSIMGDIYENAREVLASVGSHEDDSEFILQVFQELHAFHASILDEHEESRKTMLSQKYVEIITAGEVHHMDDESLAEAYSRFGRAWKAFGDREYFERIWIVQEMWLAKKLTLLCGSDSIPVELFSEPLRDLGWNNLIDRRLLPLYEVVSEYNDTWKVWSFNNMKKLFMKFAEVRTERPGCTAIPMDEVFGFLWGWQCSNFRDRIYGLLRVMEWPGEAPQPDYRITKPGLARQVIGCLVGPVQTPQDLFTLIEYLLAALDFIPPDPDSLDLIDQRWRAQDDSDGDTPELEGDSTPLARLPGHAYLVGVDEEGGSWAQIGNGTLMDSDEQVSGNATSADISDFEIVTCYGMKGAYACPSIQPGDYLMNFDGTTHGCPGAVGRYNAETDLVELIGYVFFRAGFGLDSPASLDVELNMHWEDLLMFQLLCHHGEDMEELVVTDMPITRSRWSSFARLASD